MKFRKQKCNVLPLARNNPIYLYRLRAIHLGSSLAERDLGVLVDNKLEHETTCALAAKKGNGICGCISQNTASRLMEVILCLYSALRRPHLDSCVHSWAPWYERDRDTLERD